MRSTYECVCVGAFVTVTVTVVSDIRRRRTGCCLVVDVVVYGVTVTVIVAMASWLLMALHVLLECPKSLLLSLQLPQVEAMQHREVTMLEPTMAPAVVLA